LSTASAKSMLFVLPCACSQMSAAEKKGHKVKGYMIIDFTDFSVLQSLSRPSCGQDCQ
jgi:hypothetical protein